MEQRFSKKIFAGLLVVFILVVGWFVVLQLQEKGFISLHRASCQDPDAEEKDKGIYIKSIIASYDKNGNTFSQTDRCQSERTLQESVCQEHRTYEGQPLWSSLVIDCENGCVEGRCRELIKSEVRSASFVAPYEIIWNESGATLALTGVSVVDARASEETGVLERQLVLSFKIANQQLNQVCVPMHMRLINEEKDFVTPYTAQFSFPSTKGCAIGPQTTYTDQKVVFKIPVDAKSVTFISGGVARLFYRITFEGDRDVKIVTIPPVIIVPPPSQSFRPPPPPPPPMQVTSFSVSRTTVARGDTLTIFWKRTEPVSSMGVSAIAPSNSRISVQLWSAMHNESTSFSGTDNQGDIKVKVPPGSYLVKIISPQSNVPPIPIEVTGPPQTASSNTSSFSAFFQEAGKGEIISDGICGIDLVAVIVDEFNYGLADKKVEVFSSRIGTDTIIPKSQTTDEGGTLGYFVSSKVPGISALSARVDGQQIGDSFILQVQDALLHKCPSQM